MEKKVLGIIKQVVGPIVDVQFKDQHLPELLTALEIPLGNESKLTVEVMQHIGDDAVRCVSMGPTEGLVRGMEAISTGKPIEVPVGEATLGRIFNVLGEPLDDKGDEDDSNDILADGVFEITKETFNNAAKVANSGTYEYTLCYAEIFINTYFNVGTGFIKDMNNKTIAVSLLYVEREGLEP